MKTIRKILTTYFPLLSVSPGFQMLWLATLISSLGDWMGFVALNLYVLNLTGSATALAGLLAVEAIPAMLIGPFAGVLIDRFSRRRVMIIANLVAMMAFLLLPLTDTLWQIYVLALIARLTNSFIMPAERALLPDLIGKERVIDGNAALSVIRHITLIAGPVIAGLLVAASSASIAFVADAISFAIASLFIAKIGAELPRTTSATETASSWTNDLKIGLRYALNNKAIQVLLITTMVSSIGAAALLTIEVIYVSDFLQGGDEAYGILLSVAGIGALIGSASAGRLSRRFNLNALYVATIMITGLFFFPYANIHILWVVIFIAGLHTIPWILGLILVDTLLQHWVPADMRGRVFSLIATERNAGHVLVAAVLAPLVDLWGVVIVLNIAGFVYTLAGIYAVSQLGVLRRETKVAIGVGVESV
jgi:MFS family permease